MALTRVIKSCLVLLSLVVISSAIPDYDSTETNDGFSFEHSQFYKVRGDGDHDIHHVVDELLHGNKYKPRENPEYEIPTNTKPEEHDKKTYNDVVVEGLILCKSGNAYTPIQGARAIVKCHSSYGSGYYVTSSESNEEGCFVATLFMEELKEKSINVKTCKAYPEYSPMETCNIAAPNSESYLSPSATEGGYYSAGSLVYTQEPRHHDEPDLPKDEPTVPHY